MDASTSSQGVQIQPGDFLSPDWILENDADHDNGTIAFALSQLDPSPPQSGTGVLATITWRDKAVGTSLIAFDCLLLGTLGGAQIPASTEDGEITVVEPTGVNMPPIALDDSASTDQDKPVAIDVLAQDYDLFNGLLDPTSVTIVAPMGVVTYAPVAGFYGSDSFTYTVDDLEGATSNEATVTVLVNALPVAVHDRAVMGQQKTLLIHAAANDYDPDGEINAATVAIARAPRNGSVEVDPVNGAVTYMPDFDHRGVDTFAYTVQDSNGAVSNVANVRVVIGAADEPIFVAGDEPIILLRLAK